MALRLDVARARDGVGLRRAGVVGRRGGLLDGEWGGAVLNAAAPFDAPGALAYASEILSRPPARQHIVRPEARGELVARFVLPLELCPTLNSFAEWPAWRRKKAKDSALAVMLGQSRKRWAKPLPGRPQVLAVRLSSVEPDRDSGWCKVPVDRLTPKRGGLGVISDDRPSAIDLQHWHEPAARGRGCVLVMVRSE